MMYLEELAIGTRDLLGTWTATEEEIIRFASQYDPQPFHTDPVAAKDSLLGGLCASGWQTCAMFMRLNVAYRQAIAEARRAAGEPVAQLGGSPGIEDLRWIKPVFAGDTLSYYVTVLETRPSASRPQWGLVTELNTAENQNGEPVMSMKSRYFLERSPR